ncbi:unnamed protein product [Oikopleura dioica]|uniref:Uncharacterized protein n=1 Tax=Oikopleura dioica TaxID=34765 RepID=E4X163_OIKDI|nr:unnamed protein product [Oikopleura dioica]
MAYGTTEAPDLPDENASKATWIIYGTRLQRGFKRAEEKLKEFSDGIAESARWTFDELQRYLEKNSALKTVAMISQYQHVNKETERLGNNVVALQPNGSLTTFMVKDGRAFPTSRKPGWDSSNEIIARRADDQLGRTYKCKRFVLNPDEAQRPTSARIDPCLFLC